MTHATDSPQQLQKPSVGVAVAVWKDASKSGLLLGLGHSKENRTAIYAVPGGHWESGESLAEAARRETAEEAGISIAQLELISVYEFFNPEKQKSYVTIGFSAICDGGEPTVMESENKSNWGWYVPDEALALPLFVPDKALIERAVSGVVYEEQPSQ